MTSTKSIFAPSWGFVIGIVGTYLCSGIAAGHGVGPVGLLLVFGWEYWSLPVLLGWIGIALLIDGKLFNSLRLCRQFGVASISVSWVIFLWKSDMLLSTIIFLIPFLICLFYWVKYSAKALRSR